MGSLKTQRGPVRSAFTRALNELQAEVEKDEADKTILQQLFSKLKGHHDKLISLDEKIEGKLLEANATEEEFAQEYESVCEYRERFAEIELKVNSKLSKREESESGNTGQETTSSESHKSKYRLPQLEFKKFTGEPREWLGFWSQFRNIHEDEGMAAGEKFQYLIQATAEKSVAREAVESFPPSGDNYPKVIAYIKDRFGNDDVLVEVYVRDLLCLVLHNTVSKDKVSISTLYDKLETQLRSLDTLGVTSDKYAAMLYPLVESSLPLEVLRTWERHRCTAGQDRTKNRLVCLMEFLRTEVDSEIRIKMAQNGFSNEDGKNEKSKPKGHKKYAESVPTASELFNSNAETESKNRGCVFCGKSHNSSDCFKARKMTMDEKNKIVREKRGCYVCLKIGHFSSNCKSKHQCEICSKRHFVVMCPQLPQHQREFPASNQKDSTMSNHCISGGLLQTIVVRLKSEKEERIVRALFDSGSQQSYVTEKAVSVLGLKPISECKVTHCLFGGQETQQQAHKKFEIGVISKNRAFECKLQVMDTPKICGSISRVSNGAWFKELAKVGIEITDIGNDTPDIHLLIGSDMAATLFTGKMYPTKSGPVAVETKLGWTMWGKCVKMKNPSDSSLLVTSLHISDSCIQDLWKLDVIGINDPAQTKTDKELVESARQHFLDTVSVNNEGRYEVSLPWIGGHPPVSANRELAERRLKSSYKKLKEVQKVEDYQKIFYEWKRLGVIESVPDDGREDVCYLPHRPVFKPNSITTPIRPVFDASAKMKNLPSLNDCLEKGPNLIEEVPGVLTRFRMKRYGVVSDIRKAFLQISVRKEDRDYLRFLWWEEEQLQIYRHCRVVFGVSSSPFLLAATINYHLDRVEEELQPTAQLLKKSLYIDNCITSFHSEKDLASFVRESTTIMSKAKFDLRGWIWNGIVNSTGEGSGVSSLTSRECGLEPGSEIYKDHTVIPVLGLLWNIESDTLSLDLREITKETKSIVTKRRILSAAHRIYDPIGFSAPVTLVPKLILQEVWKLKIGWDDPLPSEIEERFNSWLKHLPSLEKMEIPRCMLTRVFNYENCSLHVFTDASKKAYTACVFIRCTTGNDVNVQLVMAKSRVATIKPITIPRLELLGCCIGARLAWNVKRMIDAPDIKIIYWTDSSNSLYWIQENDNWATFVYNRVQEIRKLSDPTNWRHIPGKDNPADLPSRGCSAKQLLATRWWEGPAWLKLSSSEWPKSCVQYDMEIIQSEKKKTVVSQLAVEKETVWYARYFSKYRKIVRMIAWILRWRNKVKNNGNIGGLLTAEEENAAELVLLKLVQSEVFNEESGAVQQLRANRNEDGVWRVSTKIVMREDSKDFRFPLLLPFDHVITRMLVEHEHRKMNHCGLQVLMITLREKFWIIKSRKLLRQVIHSCGRCKRFKLKNVTPVEAPLPLDRVRDAVVFEVIGIDLGGPLYLRDKQKAWFIVFTCAVYRAVHLELVTSLSTEAFLQAFRRFVARRGRPNTIYTDNGTNFEGASNALKKLDWKKITASTAVERIIWKFNPPGAPWWGGWWERIVGMVKELLRRILGRASLDYEELQTVLCDCEATINSRPITYISEDPNDLAPLTPSMFLNENRSQGVPDVDQIDATGFNKRHKFRQELKEHLRKRFREEYLAYLVHRNPVKVSEKTIRVGEVVLIASDNKKRLAWPLARVMQLFPGRDGVVRVAKLKTATGEITRPLQRLYPLEVESDLQPNVWKDVRPKVLKKRKVVKVAEKVENQERTVVTKFGRRVKRPERFVD